jgi:acetyl esterase/lipase
MGAHLVSREYEALRANLKPGLAVPSDDVGLVREKMEAVHPTAVPPDARVEPLDLAGLECAWVDVPESEGSDRTVLYVHGGAFVSTGVAHYVPYCAGLARFIPARYLVHGYSLAPETHCPTPVHETMAVWDALLARGVDPARAFIAGDSCGGGIALAALCALRDAGRPLPAGYFGLTPWFDLEQTGVSAVEPRGVDPFVDPEWIRARGRDYVGPEGDVRDPLASPLHADLSGLPPLFLSVGGVDTTRDDSTRLAARAGQAGVDVTLEIGAEMIHGFHGLAALIPEGRAALARCGAFVRRVAPDPS